MSAGRFPRGLRLAGAAAFQRVFQDPGRLKSSDGCFLVIACHNRRPWPRLGLAIGKKYVKSAVARNRLKRLVRESFRRHQGILAGLDIVVLARPGVAERPNLRIFASLEAHWTSLVKQCKSSSSC